MNTAKKISEALVEPQAATSAHPLPQNPAPDAITVAPRRAGQRVEKAPEAFRTISEVAAEIGEEPHVLRFWETKFPPLKPIKRAGGRRYYRPEDIEILKRIQKLLRHHNFHIKGAQKLLKGNGLDEAALRQELAEPLTPTPTPTSTPDSNHGAEIPPPADKLSAEVEREKTVGFLSKVLNTISE